MQRHLMVQCQNLVKIYKIAEVEAIALQGLNLEIEQGEIVALIGSSGAGKSTLLNVVGGLELPSAGEVSVAGWDLTRMTEGERVLYKRRQVGFAWQQPARNLLPYLSLRDNVALPMQLDGVPASTRKQRALDLLETVGLAERADFPPDRLSGGEQQRAALAVALANQPPLLLGDELTGQVDSASAGRICDALVAINQVYGTTILVVTHDPKVANRMDRVVTMRDGRASTEIRRHTKDSDEEQEEWTILDPAGRMQLPRNYVNALRMKELVRVHLEPYHISVWPREDEGQRSQEDSPPEESLNQWSLPVNQEAAGISVQTHKLTRSFHLAGQDIHALWEVSLQVEAGTLTLFRGPSGSGKTTLLNLLAGLDEPTRGTIHLGDYRLTDLSPQQKNELRRQQIGFVFQTFGLLPFLSVRENVELPLRMLDIPGPERSHRLQEALDIVGLRERADHRTYELSGGEQQRVAIARAIVKRPRLILADEPTGQLDSVTGARIINLLRQIVSHTGITVIVASHDPNVMEKADKQWELQDGKLVAVDEP